MPFKTQLNGLRSLYRDMRKEKRAHEHFQVNYAKRLFDCIFYVDTDPFELLIGMVGEQWASVVKVERGFYASMDDTDFFALCNLLNLNPGKNTFTSSVFLQSIAKSAPSKVSPDLIPPDVHVKINPKIREQIDEADKIYFVRWSPQGKRAARNFKKTEKLVGKAAADFCRSHNISSCWTDDPNKARKLTNPW